MDIIFIQIRNNDQIKGLKIGNIIIKLSAYAEDTYFIELYVPSYQQISTVCKIFEELSSVKLILRNVKLLGLVLLKVNLIR